MLHACTSRYIPAEDDELFEDYYCSEDETATLHTALLLGTTAGLPKEARMRTKKVDQRKKRRNEDEDEDISWGEEEEGKYLDENEEGTDAHAPEEEGHAGEEEEEDNEDEFVEFADTLPPGQADTPPEVPKQQQQHHQQNNHGSAADSPATFSTPITNHFDSVLECIDYMDMVEDNEQVEKADVIDAIRGRMHNMLSKILLNNSISSMSMLGWKLE